jgi:hypothetical protein
MGWLVKSNRPKAPMFLGDYPCFLNELVLHLSKPLQQSAARVIEFDGHIEGLACLDRIEGRRETQRPMRIQIAIPFLLYCHYSNHCLI